MDEVDRPGPGEALNPGQATTPRRAASVILLRDASADGAVELLLVKRNPEARFMGGAWVFPGGAVHDDDGDGDDGHRAAAVRELSEEAGVDVDPSELVAFSRWITPAMVKVRFDTYFFLARVPEGAQPRVDGAECVDLGWFTPDGALERHRAGELMLVFPTIKQLEQLSPFGSVAELLDHARGQEIRPVEPRVLISGETARILLPGDPGYDDPQ